MFGRWSNSTATPARIANTTTGQGSPSASAMNGKATATTIEATDV